MNARTTMSGKGQVVIPKDVRTRMRLVPGDRLEVVERADGVLLRRLTDAGGASFDEITARIRARIGHAGPPVPIDDMERAIGEMWTGGGPRWDA